MAGPVQTPTKRYPRTTGRVSPRRRLTVACLGGRSGKIAVVRVPWVHFHRRGIAAYSRAIRKLAPTLIAVTVLPGGGWATAPHHVRRWDRLLGPTTLRDLPWRTVLVADET